MQEGIKKRKAEKIRRISEFFKKQGWIETENGFLTWETMMDRNL